MDKQYQPLIINAGNVLAGVAQVRIGRPSVRAAGTAATDVAQPVGKSEIFSDVVNGVTTPIVVPKTVYVANGGSIASQTIGAAYTGAVDGAIILRATTAGATASFDIYDTTGVKTTEAAAANVLTATVQGVSVSITFTAASVAIDDTWVIPCHSASAQDKLQTGIISPYPIFRGASNSVGGLTAASFEPSADDIKALESGFPATIVDRMISKTSVKIAFTAQEHTNINLAYLESMVSATVNQGKIASLPVEIVMGTRGGDMVSFWVPNATLTSLPKYSPTNDYSTTEWTLEASQPTEVVGGAAIYNAWLRNTWMYRKHTYIH
jgi:hypothetical protein